MNISQIRKYDVANGQGIRTTIFVSGCTHNCKGCFNKEYQNFNYGSKFTSETEDLILNYLADPNVKGLSVLGGEPFQNVDGLIDLLHRVSREFPEKDVWVWTGYTWEEIVKDKEKRYLLPFIDVLIDGKFIESKKNLKLKFRGSSNQRVIDVYESLKANEVKLYIE